MFVVIWWFPPDPKEQSSVHTYVSVCGGGVSCPVNDVELDRVVARRGYIGEVTVAEAHLFWGGGVI